MKTVVLGQTGLRVSRVGIGGIPLTRPAEDETVKLVRHALDLGITFIDTAHAYGNSEEKCPYDLPIREMLAENLAFYEAVAAEHNVS